MIFYAKIGSFSYGYMKFPSGSRCWFWSRSYCWWDAFHSSF